MGLKRLFFYEIPNIAQKQGALPPDIFRNTFSMRSILFKMAGAGYCLYKLRHREMLAFD